MKNLILVIIAFFLPIFPATGQPHREQADWKLVERKGDIKVYAKAVADSKIKALKAECILNASAAEVVALLLDVKAAEKWVCHTKSCSLVRKISETEIYYYTEVSLPWPLDNRDFVTHLTVSEDPVTKIVTVNAPAVSGWVPIKKGIVRVSHSKSSWIIKPMGEGKVTVEYALQVDPGGHIPACVVNTFACQGPVETFTNMKKELRSRK
ncbi:START domain-containing protein [Dyadobacter pollutisoli]|uniref:START domain-containing protein n=1 Tax=Dyadobacter pollutisoli TaxID=2910158 RepID=A0A9E8NEC2_9BACT|nr:START domain-containing protein [Dyadobacter pollutisoli]WAC12594.1 START domain-containing protein [Dyadobacter pollutisoli]